MPDSYDAMVGEDRGLSDDQKQQLTITRAIVKGALMIILKETTSSVDTRTEKCIQEVMDTLMDRRTSFVIAHRLSIIRNTDVILVLRDGNIVKQGTH